MDTQDDLFNLIQSLSKSEKKYFRQYTKLHVIGDKNNYIRLFDFLDKQKVYNKYLLLQTFKNERFTKNFNVAKAYLFSVIMRSLQSYYAGLSAETRIRNLLNDVDILISKGLNEKALKLARQAVKMAKQHETYALLLHALDWERKCIFLSGKLTSTIKERNDFVQEQEIVGCLNNIYTYRILTRKAAKITDKTSADTIPHKDLLSLNALMKDDLLQSEKKAITTYSKHLYYSLHHIHALYNRDFRNARNILQKLISILESHPYYTSENPYQYYETVFNLLLNARHTGNEDLFFKT
jgi:hypothetical protein